MENKTNNFVHIVGAANLKAEELSLVEKYAAHTLEKISKISEYDNLKIAIKKVHSTNPKHQRFTINMMLSNGRKIVTVKKHISAGTADEIFNDKVKTEWNVVNVIHDALKALKEKVSAQQRKLIKLYY